MSKSSTDPTDASTVWSPQTGYLEDLYEGGANLLASQPTESDLTQEGRAGTVDYARSPALSNLIKSTTGALESRLKPGQNPYLQQAMSSAIRPLTQNYQENVLGGITDEFAAAGQHGGSRQGIAEGIAGREYLQQVGDIGTEMAYQDYAGGQERMGQAIDQAGNVINLGLTPSQILSGAGREEQLAPWQQLQLQQGLIGAPTVLGGGGGGGQGGTSSALGGVSDVIGTAAGAAYLFSDERLKEDIEDIKDSLDKVMSLKPKSFKYINAEQEHDGFIAQDAEKVAPYTVKQEDGLYMMNYGALTPIIVDVMQQLVKRLDGIEERLNGAS